MRRKILLAIAMQCPCKIIHDKGAPYLERYFLFNALGLRFYLHRFVASDPDRGLHDHPWPWALSIILLNKYMELLRGAPRLVRWFNFISGSKFHRVIVADGQEVWSIFIHPNNYNKPWGFLRPVIYYYKNADDNRFYQKKVLEYVQWNPRNRKEGDTKTDWEKRAPLGKDIPRNERQIAIVN